MWRTVQILIAAAGALVMGIAALDAEGAASTAQREIIPGSELMTHAERERYRQRMRGAGTPEEEQAVRSEHLRQVRERARLRGLRIAEPGEQNKRGK